jgi:DNA ligase D-like protein (predicted 3'-phosphoesterase)
MGMKSPSSAIRAVLHGDGVDAARRDAVAQRARTLKLHGWARADEPGTVRAHIEGDAAAVAQLAGELRNGALAPAAEVEITSARAEGHEQFALRGVSAGEFVVQEHAATAHHFDFRLEVDGVMRSWAVPKGPSLDPAVKRLAVEVEDHSKEHNTFEGKAARGGVIVWDRGTYEQGGRVSWPEALDRGHAVFVLHGEKLRGGFALQRTGGGAKPQWLLVKRRDDEARPGSDVVAESPQSVVSGRTLGEVVEGAG